MIKSKIYWITKCGVFSGPCFPVFGQNTEIYTVYSVQIRENTDQKNSSWKIRTRKNSSFGYFSRSVFYRILFTEPIFWNIYFFFLLKQHAAKVYG